MSARSSGRTIGALVLLAFLLYGGGTSLVAASTGPAGAGAPADLVPAGVLLILLNSVAVAAIGAVAHPVLRPHSEVAAAGYLAARVLEAVLLAVGALALLVAAAPSASGGPDGSAGLLELARAADAAAYTSAMLVLGLGSLLFCRVLLRARLVPRALALWGMVGYATVAVGMALEVLGHGLGLVVWIPGGLFEVALGVLLLARGFTERAHHPPVPEVAARGL